VNTLTVGKIELNVDYI